MLKCKNPLLGADYCDHVSYKVKKTSSDLIHSQNISFLFLRNLLKQCSAESLSVVFSEEQRPDDVQQSAAYAPEELVMGGAGWCRSNYGQAALRSAYGGFTGFVT